MACNGKNHPPDCQCNFRGGHPNSHTPNWRGWTKSTAARFTDSPNAVCPDCGAWVWYVPCPNGGRFYSDTPGPPWKKHPCTSHPAPYSPFNSKRRPRLRNRRSKFEKGGWLPVFIKKIEELPGGTIIVGVALDNPTKLYFGISEEIVPDKERPIYFQRTKREKKNIKINFFPINGDEPLEKLAYDNCFSSMDLSQKIRS